MANYKKQEHDLHKTKRVHLEETKSRTLELLAEPQCIYCKFCMGGGIQQLGQARKKGGHETLQGDADTYKEPQCDRARSQKYMYFWGWWEVTPHVTFFPPAFNHINYLISNSGHFTFFLAFSLAGTQEMCFEQNQNPLHHCRSVKLRCCLSL